MRSILVCFLLAAKALCSGWTFIADLPQCGYPTGIYADEDGSLVVKFEKLLPDSLYRNEILVDSDGSIEVLGENLNQISNQAEESLFLTSPFPEDIENPYTFSGITHLSSAGDTLWSVVLDSIQEREETFQPVIRCDEGGCFAVFAPDGTDFIWEVYRLSDSGDVLMNGEFIMRGGPVIGVSTLKETADSSYLICGTTDDLGMNLYMFLTGIDSEGNEFFQIMEDFRFHASGGIIELDDEGNIYIAGYTGFERDDGYFMPPADTDVFLLKLDPTGREIWRTVFEYPLENRPSCMYITEEGNIAVVFNSFSYEETDPPGNHSLVLFQED